MKCDEGNVKNVKDVKNVKKRTGLFWTTPLWITLSGTQGVAQWPLVHLDARVADAQL